MKAEIGSMQKSHGEIKLMPESVDDLWHLEHLITPGSLVFATTLRSVESATDKARPDKQEKKPVRLGIRVEKVEFHEYAVRLRVFGIIEHGPDTGSYHTLNLEPKYEVSVIKTWQKTEFERIERSVKSSACDLIHVLAIEEGLAELYRLYQYGPKLIFDLTLGSGKGADTDNRQEFYDRIVDQLGLVSGPLIIAGPGFIKEDLAAKFKQKYPAQSSKLVVAETRRSGYGAVQDVIGQGAPEKMIGDIQLTREVECMDNLLSAIAKDEPVAYGREEVLTAIDFGAVQNLLVSDSCLKDKSVIEMMEKTEKMQASIVVLSTRFEPGKRLDALGGIAAFLRYRI